MSTSTPCFECGLCCTQLIIEIEHLDVVREPALLEHATLLDGHGTIQYDDEWDKVYGLAAGFCRPCPMLTTTKQCAIYPTRPNCCVSFEVGGAKCNELRVAASLPSVPPDAPRTT